MFSPAVYLRVACRPARTLLSFASVRRCSSFSTVQRFHQFSPLLCPNAQRPDLLGQHKSQPMRLQPSTTICRPFQTSRHVRQTESEQSKQKNELLLSQMNIRLVNENSFLSWCRNAYLSTVVGVAMMAEGASALAQSAGLGALLVGTMNLAWGTGCHVTNLVRLRHVSGMSGLTLSLHLVGSSLHCFLWAFVLICYIGFLDESRWPADEDGSNEGSAMGRDKQKRGLGDGLRRV